MTVTVKNQKGNLPKKEGDLNAIAAEIAAYWETQPQITLLWTDVAKFKAASKLFGQSYAERADMKGIRRGVTQELKDINAEMNSSIEQLKAYLAEIFGRKNAQAYYETFGIVKEQAQYKLPKDNDRRLYALETLLRGIDAHALGERKYGKKYWEEIYARFTSLKKQASEADSYSTQRVRSKAEQKLFIHKTLNALILNIRSNYPDTWRNELRIWGFRKERY
jgi:IS1 family transposase